MDMPLLLAQIDAGGYVWPYALGVGGALLALALLSLLETALASINPARLRQWAQEGRRAAPRIERLIERPQELLLTFVVLMTALIVLIATLTTTTAARFWGVAAIPWVNLGVFLVLLLCGVIIPKTVSMAFAESIALRCAWIVTALRWLVTPVTWTLNGIGQGLVRVLTGWRVLPGHANPVPTAFSGEDVKQLLTAGEQSGDVEATEREMINGVIEFSATTAAEIMVPRTDLATLAAEATMEEAIREFMESGHSRIPVYEDNVDNVVGLLYVKDLLIRLHEAGTPPPITELLRPVYFVPESKKSDELLREMQRKQVHLAVVVDEYGGTAGIVTIEDLLEEIVGDIVDEYDQESEEVTRQPDGTSLVSGRASLDKIEETFDLTMPDDVDAETISGLVAERLGHIPEVGDTVVLEGVEFIVLEVAHNRAEYLRARVLPPGETPEEG